MANIRAATHLDMQGNQLLNALIHPVNGLPTAQPDESGKVIYNTGDNRLYVNENGAWKLTATSADSINNVTVTELRDRSTHTGTQTAATISDLAAVVKAYKLSDFAPSDGDIALANNKITGLKPGTANTDAATYGQLLEFVNNQSFKAPVKAATVNNITLSGVPANIDGVPVSAGDRILVRGQTNGSANGIYTVASGAWSRTNDTLVPGMIVPVDQGRTHGDKLLMLVTNGPITVGTTPLVFSIYGGGNQGEVGQAGNGLQKSGTTYSVVAGEGISVTASGVSLDTTKVARKFSAAVPAGSKNPVITHGLNSNDVSVTVYIVATNEYVLCPWAITSENAVTLDFAVAPTAGQYRVVVIG